MTHSEGFVSSEEFLPDTHEQLTLTGEAAINPIACPRGYFDAQVQFAQKWSAITGEEFGQTLLHKTALYRRLWDAPAPKDATPEAWTDMLDGFSTETPSDDIAQSLYDAYLETPQSKYVPPENPRATGYDYYPDRQAIKIHFTNPVRGENPFSEANMPQRREDFKWVLSDILANHPEAQVLISASWIRSLRSYRSLSPPDIAEQESLMSPDMAFGGDSVWGQFIDRSGNTNQRVYDQFTEAVQAAETIDQLLEAFPYKTLRAQDPISKYYRHYDLESE